VSKGSVASGRVGVWAYGRMGVWAYGRDEWVSSGVRTAEWADVGRGAATDGIRLLPQAREYSATGLNGTGAVYGTGSPRPRKRGTLQATRYSHFTTVSPARTPMVWVMLTWAHSYTSSALPILARARPFLELRR
jgi:hypothetical protein